MDNFENMMECTVAGSQYATEAKFEQEQTSLASRVLMEKNLEFYEDTNYPGEINIVPKQCVKKFLKYSRGEGCAMTQVKLRFGHETSFCVICPNGKNWFTFACVTNSLVEKYLK